MPPNEAFWMVFYKVRAYRDRPPEEWADHKSYAHFGRSVRATDPDDAVAKIVEMVGDEMKTGKIEKVFLEKGNKD